MQKTWVFGWFTNFQSGQVPKPKKAKTIRSAKKCANLLFKYHPHYKYSFHYVSILNQLFIQLFFDDQGFKCWISKLFFQLQLAIRVAMTRKTAYPSNAILRTFVINSTLYIHMSINTQKQHNELCDNQQTLKKHQTDTFTKNQYKKF